MIERFVLAAIACSMVVVGSGCSSADGAVDAGTDAAPGDPSVVAGTFQVRLIAPTPTASGYTAIVGKVSDGPTPAQIVWEQAAAEGSCRLLKPRVPFCNTPCGGSAVCIENDTCQNHPAAQNVGTVHTRGVRTEAGASEFSMEAVAKSYQPPASVKCPFPAFDEGDDLTFTTTGGAYAPFALRAKGIVPLTLLTGTLRLEDNQPLTLTWTPPGLADLSAIHVKLDISHHGGTKGMIECDASDTGSLLLPAALLTQLKNLGVAGFPTIVVTRKAVGSTVIAPGRIDLVISSDIERAVEIPGVRSCTSDMDCPGGQTCQNDLTCK